MPPGAATDAGRGKLGAALAAKLKPLGAVTVVAPAMGGLVIGQEVARQLRVRFISVEKEEGKLVLRRGFKIAAGEKIPRRGGCRDQRAGGVQETRIFPCAWRECRGIAMVVDRSNGALNFGVPTVSLVALHVETFDRTICRRTCQMPAISGELRWINLGFALVGASVPASRY